MTQSSPLAAVVGMAVQFYREELGVWRNINDRILVRDYHKPGLSEGAALAAARREGDRQVTGWSNAFPLRQYRLQAVRADGSLTAA